MGLIKMYEPTENTTISPFHDDPKLGQRGIYSFSQMYMMLKATNIL
jgi:hypothetical protein